MNPEDLPPCSTVREFQERYGVCRASVYNWAKRQGLKLTKIGPQAARILKEDEEEWLARRREAAPHRVSLLQRRAVA